MIPGWGAKIPHASQLLYIYIYIYTHTHTYIYIYTHTHIKQKHYCNKFNKDFKHGPPQKKLLKNLPLKKRRLILKLKLQYFCHPMRRADSLEKTLKLGKIEGKRRSRQQKDEMVRQHH